jgi:hypothetical protein
MYVLCPGHPELDSLCPNPACKYALQACLTVGVREGRCVGLRVGKRVGRLVGFGVLYSRKTTQVVSTHYPESRLDIQMSQ